MRHHLSHLIAAVLALVVGGALEAQQITGEAPSNLAATVSGSTIVVTWTGTTDAQGYRVFRALTQSGSFAELTSRPITATTYTDATPPRATLWYKVAAVYAGKVQPGYTEAVGVTRPGPAYGEIAIDASAGRGTATPMARGEAPEVEVHQWKVRSDKVGSDTLSIYWGKRVGSLLHRMTEATGFTVARAESRSGPWVTLTAPQADPDQTVHHAGAFAALMPDDTVFYRVTATYAGKLPGVSAPAWFARTTRPVEDLRSSQPPGSIGTVKLSWRSFHPETRVFRNGQAVTTNPVTAYWEYSGAGGGWYNYQFSDTNVPLGTHAYQVSPLVHVTGKGWVAGDLARQPSVSVTVKARPERECPANLPNCRAP